MADVRLAFFIDKIRLAGRRMLLFLCWLLFRWLTAVKPVKLGAAKKFLLLCIRKACILPHCMLSHSLVKIRRRDTSVPHFFKTLRSLCLILSWTAVVKSKKTSLTTIFYRVFTSFMYTFYSQFSTQTDWTHVAKRARCWKKPNIFSQRISFIQWGKNEIKTKLS